MCFWKVAYVVWVKLFWWFILGAVEECILSWLSARLLYFKVSWMIFGILSSFVSVIDGFVHSGSVFSWVGGCWWQMSWLFPETFSTYLFFFFRLESVYSIRLSSFSCSLMILMIEFLSMYNFFLFDFQDMLFCSAESWVDSFWLTWSSKVEFYEMRYFEIALSVAYV